MMNQGNQQTGLAVISDSSLATTVAQNSRYPPNSLSGESEAQVIAFLPYASVNSKRQHPSPGEFF